jgi:hypothetical protein
VFEGWTLTSVRDEELQVSCPDTTQIITVCTLLPRSLPFSFCSLSYIFAVVFGAQGQSRFKKEKYGMCVEGDASAGQWTDNKYKVDLDKTVWDPKDVAALRKSLQTAGTAAARPSYGGVLWMPGVYHYAAPEYEETYGSCVLHLKSKFNEASTIYNQDAVVLGCADARNSNSQW